jgi:hypothetical protein
MDRSEVLPDLPPVAEFVPGFEASSCFSHCAIGSSACTDAPSASNMKSPANTHFVVGADRKRSCDQSFLHRWCWPYPFFRYTPKAAAFTRIDLVIRQAPTAIAP